MDSVLHRSKKQLDDAQLLYDVVSVIGAMSIVFITGNDGFSVGFVYSSKFTALELRKLTILRDVIEEMKTALKQIGGEYTLSRVIHASRILPEIAMVHFHVKVAVEQAVEQKLAQIRQYDSTLILSPSLEPEERAKLKAENQQYHPHQMPPVAT